MSDTSADEEPTMEEILASIRRIISDESEDEADDAQSSDVAEDQASPELEPELEPEPDPEPKPKPAPEPEIVQIEDAVAELVPEQPEPEPEPELAPAQIVEEDPVPEPEEDDVLELTEIVSGAGVSGIVSDMVESEAATSFAHLSNLMVSQYPGSENTLEGLVREMLRPMLQGWLDEHLPKIVQDAVEREVARIARRR